MSVPSQRKGLSEQDLHAILAVTRALAAPFDLTTMLSEVVNAAKQVLRAERGSVWLYEPEADELVLEVATGIAPVRVPAGAGMVGACAHTRDIINVPDCYADPRFNPEVDKRTGYRTRCMLTLPLVDHKDALVGVMQVLNKIGGVFDADDEALATALAAQCAVALQRVRMTAALIEGERMRQELEMARAVQMSTLPAAMPEPPGYDVFGLSRPADQTGGDTFDLAMFDQGLLAVLGDATGHGIAPALSVTQMQAMLRMAFRLGADLETAFTQVNNQLADTLPADRFITAFIGLLDTSTHRVRFHSGGQGPILHFGAASGTCARYRPTSFPLGAMRVSRLRPTVVLEMAPGDILALLSDGIYEYHDPDNEQFGETRVEQILQTHHGKTMAELSAILLESVQTFARGAPQADDMTLVLVKRIPEPRHDQRSFRRSFEALPDIVAFTSGFFAQEQLDPSLLSAVDFAVEELFTNMVKYSATSTADVRIDLTAVENGVEVTLTDYDVEPFDVTRAPDVDVTLPIEQRQPGGLGLHLIRRLVDAVEYQYSPETRQSRIRLRKTGAKRAESGAPNSGGTHVVD
jgi:phosphoserine phosphatase